jgi:radical SAM protein with 4Fe4S-binding SPASM domain
MNKPVDTKRRMDDCKLLWHKDRARDRFVHGRRIAPIHIDMGIAKFCNISCVFCYGFSQDPSNKFIQRDALLNTVIDARSIGVKSLGFIGDGEPTCNPHLWDALRTAGRIGIDASISTNGYIVNTDERRAAILENCRWMRFCFSAGTREGYKAIHRRDYFDAVARNIGDMVKYRDSHGLKCEIGLQAVFVPTLMSEEMIEESRLAVELGVDYLVIKQCSLPDAGESGMAQFDVKLYDDPRITEVLEECQAMTTDRTEIIPKWNLMHQKGGKPYDHCPSISLISEISGNGDWFPCGYFFGDKPQFSDLKFGNVHDNRLFEIWASDRYWKIIEHMENEFVPSQMCKGCCRQDKCNEWCHNYRHAGAWAQKQLEMCGTPMTIRGVNFV